MGICTQEEANKQSIEVLFKRLNDLETLVTTLQAQSKQQAQTLLQLQAQVSRYR
jgi:hypothetical protein